MKRLLLPAVLGAAVFVAASGPSRSAGTQPAAGPGDAEVNAPVEAGPAGSEPEGRLARAELLAGLTPVEGPGLTVTLRNSPRKPPRGLDKSNLLLHDRDVNAVLNALRAAGAEALAVAGAGPALPERVTNNTVAVSAKGGFLVNGTELKSPLRLLAIGNPVSLRAELARKDGAIRGAGLDVLQMVEIAEAPVLQIPAARHRLEFRFARKSSGESPVRVAVTPPEMPSAAVKPVVPAPPVVPVTPPGGDRVVAVKPRATPGGPAAGPASSAVRPAENLPENPPTTAALPPDSGTGGVPSPARASEQPPAKPASGQPGAAEPTVSGPRKEPVAVAIPPRTKRPVAPMGVKPESRPPAESVSGPVFGGKGLAKYHVTGCRFGERIGRLERVTFVSPEEARGQGRTPCQVCCGGGA